MRVTMFVQCRQWCSGVGYLVKFSFAGTIIPSLAAAILTPEGVFPGSEAATRPLRNGARPGAPIPQRLSAFPSGSGGAWPPMFLRPCSLSLT